MEQKNNSASGVDFNFKKTETTNIDKTVETQTVVKEDKNVAKVEDMDDLTKPYTDKRSVTIKLVKNYSLFRQANDKVMPKRRDYIGSSVLSSRKLAANADEIAKYFPNLVGIPSNHAEFMSRVKSHLNNIRVYVDEIGRKFDTSFHYYKKSDYLWFVDQEEKIEQKFKEVDRNDTSALKKAVNAKVEALHDLESKKYEFGHPVNVEDYLMYRHCLIYNHVAKDQALVNSNRQYRFYFEDDKRVAIKTKQHRLEIKNAKINYVACLENNELFDAMYIMYCVNNNLPVLSSLAEDKLDREMKLDKFSMNEPKKFNELYKDKDIITKAFIERLIARGELIRPKYTQNITTVDGEFIGANIIEAVAWFKNPNNIESVNIYTNKLKNL